MNYRGRYVIIGPPGTGKTRRIAQSVARIVGEHAGGMGASHGDVPCVVCSLTRTAAAEAAGRTAAVLPANGVGTLHSLAYRALRNPDMTEGHLADWNTEHAHLHLTPGDMDDPYAGERADSAAMDYHRIRAANTPDRAKVLLANNHKVRPFAVAWERWKSENGYLDFTDLIEVAERDVDACPGSPGVILADEAQDCSRLEFRLLAKWGEAAGALIIVGDPWQALYEWRGANPGEFTDESVPATSRDVLHQSWRVPRAVHAAATAWMRRMPGYTPIEYLPRDADGTVDQRDFRYGVPDYSGMLPEIRGHLDDGKTVMVMAACGYMIDPLVKTLRDRGVPFANPWRLKNGRWNPLRVGMAGGVSMADRLLAFLTPLTGATKRAISDAGGDGTDFDFGANVEEVRKTWTLADVARFSEVFDAQANFQRGQKSQLDDDATETPATEASPVLLANYFTPETTEVLGRISTMSVRDAVAWYRTRLLKSKQGAAILPANIVTHRGPAGLLERPRLYVGTIHSFKGSEADIVYVFPDLSGAAWREWSAGPAARPPIYRMFYVAMTRAKERLVICSPSTPMAVEMVA